LPGRRFRGSQRLNILWQNITIYGILWYGLAMKLRRWAESQGIPYKTAWLWFKAGKLPVKAYQTETGTIIVVCEEPLQAINASSSAAAVYARVSPQGQKNDLDAQAGRVAAWAATNGYAVTRVITEIGSGLNPHRKQLMSLLADSSINTIIVEHRDRLMRFGSEYVESSLAAQNRKLVIIDQGEINDDLAQDMVDILTSFCARLYGRRSAANRAKKAMEAAGRGNFP
jgi:predicted site-specific integrase-resolvase